MKKVYDDGLCLDLSQFQRLIKGMKFLKGALLLILVGAVWSTSSLVKTYRLNQLVAIGKIPYGPIPNESGNYYSYDGLHSAFKSKLELRRADEFTKLEFHKQCNLPL